MAQEVKYNTSHHAGATPEARLLPDFATQVGRKQTTPCKRALAPLAPSTTFTTPAQHANTEQTTKANLGLMAQCVAQLIPKVSIRRK